ncbi:MAG: VCBS repeat-containing protein [bacterium]|nr:VCBS repeat-containing protein [bacterium]
MKELWKELNQNRGCLILLLILLWPLISTGCLKTAKVSPSKGQGQSAAPLSSPVLFLAQAQFRTERQPNGETRSIPGAAKLTLVRKVKDRWESSVLEDPESNVFHKALWFTPPGGQQAGILTIAGNAAALKLWHQDKNGKWKGTSLWKPTFGGEQNRLRDIEVGDVTGDGVDDLVVATHDQGIVAVLQWKPTGWEVTELDRTPNTFVHEIEIGDLDQDGKNEFFATPSAPNRLDGTPQPGKIVMYRFDGQQFIHHTIEEFPNRHVKEILLADVNGSGYPDLFAAVEGEMATVLDQPKLIDTAKIKQYRMVDGQLIGQIIADLPDMLCRYLTCGDVDGDGSPDIVASTMQSGIWLLRQKKGEQGRWEKSLIDSQSSGFEHATLIADLDHDGHSEIYVASDDQHFLRRYQWSGERFQRDELIRLQADDLTFGLTLGQIP